METINERLKRLREQKGITALEMAKLLQIPASTYREWEYGRAIRGEPYIKIAKILNVSVYELLSGISPTSAVEKIAQIEILLKELRLQLET